MPKANWKKRKRNEEGKSEAKSGGYGAEGADDGYPPPHVLENAEFEKYYGGLGIVPEGEWDAFISMLRAPLGVSFRIMGHPDDPTALALRDFMEAEHVSRMTELTVPGIGAVPAPSPIAWLPARLSWRFDVSRAILRGKGARRGAEGEEPPPPTEADLASKARLAAFHEFLTTEVDLGNMCRQEEVSMVPPELLRVEPGHRVLDMCAAPGSKTQQILEHLMAPMKASGAALAAPGGGGAAGAAGGNGVAGGAAGGCSSAEGGYVIANDADYKRCHLLVHQAKRLNSPRLIVTNHDVQMLPTRMPGAGGATVRLRFERVLCDVPCTGDGTLRKAPDLWRRWTERLAWGVHRLQLGILLRGLDLLLPGGRLVYSTCSMNPIEDEAVVAAALAQYNSPAAAGAAGGAQAPRRRARVYLEPTDGQLPGLKRLPGLTSWCVYAGGEFYDALDAVPAGAKREKMSRTMFPPPPPGEGGPLGLERCMRVLPHMQDTGGFFIAVFRKEELDEGEEEEEEAGGAGAVAAPLSMPSVAAGGGEVAADGVEVAADGADVPSDGGEVPAVGDAQPPVDLEAEEKKRAAHGLCFAFQTGTCSRGARCRYAHLKGEFDAASGQGVAAPRAVGLQQSKAAPHVKGVVHCSARNHGKYDALFSLHEDFVATVKRFFGLGDGFPDQQLVARAATGKSVVFLSAPLLAILLADCHTRLRLINTGVRVFEHCEDAALPFPFRLTQEGIPCLLPYMGPRQLIFASTSDMRKLLSDRVISGGALQPDIDAAAPGCVVVVHDPRADRSLDRGAPTPLCVTAVRTKSSPPSILLRLKLNETCSLLRRMPKG